MRLFCIIYLACITAQCGHHAEHNRKPRKKTDTATQRARIDPRPTKEIDDEFLEYIEGFPVKFDHLAMWFEDRPGNTLGTCKEWPSGHQGIMIDPDRWEDLSWLRRKTLIWHELAHCTSLDLRHNNDYWSFNGISMKNYVCHEEEHSPREYRCHGIPNSIMNWRLPGDEEMALMMLDYNPNLDDFTKLFLNSLN